MPENHNIEDFFRKRLENHELNFQEEDWLLLENRLETVHPSPSVIGLHFNPKTILIIAAALTAAFFLGWMASELFQDTNADKTRPDRTEQSLNPAVKTDQNQVPGMNNKQIQIPALNKTKEPDPFIDSPGQQHSPKALSEAVTENEAARPAATLTASDTELNTVRAATKLTATDTELNTVKGETIPMIDKIKPLQAIVPLQLYSPDISGFDITQPPEYNMPNGYGWISRWSIGLILAPDYNGVRLFKGNTVTLAVGGIISFQLAHRWSASVRAIYNNKKYSSQPRYYKLPEGYWIKRTNGVIPENIMGSCRVIDVPVMVTYKVLQKKNISFMASAGFGSYFMLDEKYDFEFNQSNPGADTQWQTQKNSTVLFGTANIALGIGFQTTPRINVAFEPYLKIPLKKIGWGNVDLYSMGLSLTVKYRL